jgi:hypothetical protein
VKLRLMGAAVEVAELLAVLYTCPRLHLAAVSAPRPNRGRGSGLVRVYAEAGIRAQTQPCHGAGSAVWVGETTGPAGPVQLWSCEGCGGTWTTVSKRPEVPR